jgi:hypothetical protein
VTRRLGALLWLVLCAWAVGPASAAVHQCVTGGSIAAPLDFAAPQTWSPPVVPDASSDLRLDGACAVRCNAGECHARTLEATHPGASIEIAPGATLVLAGCDDASAYDVSTSPCGAENGARFAPQGAIVHDSSLDGDVFVRGAAFPSDPKRLRLVLAQAIDAAPGDWLQIRSGPSRSHVFRVIEVALAGCPNDPASCRIDVALHDPAMEFGQNAQTAGYPTGIGYLPPGTVRIAAPDQPGYAENELDRCVELCTARAGGACLDSAALGRNHAFAGWMLGASDAALDPANPAVMGGRALIVETRNGVAETIGGGGGQVDRVCFAEPMPAAWVPATGWVDGAAVVWPGFWPGDDWLLFRPATVRYAGAEGDGGLGFHGACVDADFAYFDGWAKLATREGTPACQRPYQDTVIVSWARGIAGETMHQQSACNGHSLDLLLYDALAGDRVAIVDTRTAIDGSNVCYAGLDPAIDSGFHGLALAGTRFDPVEPPAEWLIRYAGDDGAFIDTDGLGPITLRFPRWTWWWNDTGLSTEVLDFLAADPGQTVALEDARIVMYANSPGCKGALDDPTQQVAYDIDGLLYVDPGHFGPIVGLGASTGHVLDGVLAFGNPTTSCAAMRGGRIRRSWLNGWSRLVEYQVREVDRVRFAARGTTASGAIFGWLPEGQSVTLREFVLTGLPGISLINPVCGAGCDLTMENGFAAWTAPYSHGVANFYSTATVNLVAPLERLLFSNSRLLSCSTGWGESGVDIGRNLLHLAPSGVAINNPTTCPLAAPQKLVTTTGFAPRLPFRADLEDERFGPTARVGLPEDATIAIEAGLTSGFAIPAEPCANGVDDDWDGAVDLADLGCSDEVDASERTALWACDDGLDNDGDGLADAGFDPGCPRGASMPENPACDDGLDNDGDGFVDFADPQCSPANPYAEHASACGLGFEVGGLALLLWRRVRTRRRAR